LNGEHLLGDRIWVEEYKNFTRKDIAEGKRVGIDYAEEFAEVPWRFWAKGNSYVSKLPKRKKE
jgi:DNA-3-methyladenine glycosylase